LIENYLNDAQEISVHSYDNDNDDEDDFIPGVSLPNVSQQTATTNSNSNTQMYYNSGDSEPPFIAGGLQKQKAQLDMQADVPGLDSESVENFEDEDFEGKQKKEIFGQAVFSDSADDVTLSSLEATNKTSKVPASGVPSKSKLKQISSAVADDMSLAQESVISGLVDAFEGEEGDGEKSFGSALPLYIRVLEGRITVFGLEHPLVLETQHSIAETLRLTGKFGEAIELAETIVFQRKKFFDEAHPIFIETYVLLAQCLISILRVFPPDTLPELESNTGGETDDPFNPNPRKAAGPTLAQQLNAAMALTDMGKYELERTATAQIIAKGATVMGAAPVSGVPAMNPMGSVLGLTAKSTG